MKWSEAKHFAAPARFPLRPDFSKPLLSRKKFPQVNPKYSAASLKSSRAKLRISAITKKLPVGTKQISQITIKYLGGTPQYSAVSLRLSRTPVRRLLDHRDYT
jgi:hypothetical protein